MESPDIDISALNLSAGDVILVRGDVEDQFLDYLATMTGHFIIVIPRDVTLDVFKAETQDQLWEALEKHLAERS